MSATVMNAATLQLNAGGLLLAKTKVDKGASEQIVARTYRHPALGERPVVRLTSDRLGQAEDLAMEFLGFAAPRVSPPIALQQRRSLSFAAWALINDPDNARYALDLVKRMKAAARQARSKPGHAWDAYADMAMDLGRSARHFLPAFWEEVGRTFKDLGNQTYAGRALNKSMEAERVHALESDRARRRDVILEFVLSGCLSGNALSEYAEDLQSHYSPAEAFAIFRDLCVRRTRGGMAPWATMPKDFIKMAKAAGLDGDLELDNWLEEVIDTPAMGRPPQQFWKTCGGNCKRLVERNAAFAVALLRHTRPEDRYYGESRLGPWLDLLQEWGVLDFLWEDEHRGAPALGEPIATWFGRIVRDESPAPKRILEMLARLAPRLKKEKTPLALAVGKRYGVSTIDIDVLEACLALGVTVNDPPPGFAISFAGWLSANIDHPFRNQDIVRSWKDERFKGAVFRALDEALACRGGTQERGWRQTNLEQRPFPVAAGERPGIQELWRLHASGVIARLETSALASFEMARNRLTSTLWPDTLRLFPDLAERLQRVDAAAMLQRTLQAGLFDEYGLPAFEQAVDQGHIKLQFGHYGDSNIFLTFPCIVVSDKVHAHVIAGDGSVKKHELRLPKKCELQGLVAVGDDLAIAFRDTNYQPHFHWASNPGQQFATPGYYGHHGGGRQMVTVLDGGRAFLGQQIVRPGDKQMPMSQPYLHDGERFWRLTSEYDQASGQHVCRVGEINPETGKQVRASVPPWFEETEGGTVEFEVAELLPAPAGVAESPLGMKNGMFGWKTVKRRDGSYWGQGIDGRRWDKPLLDENGAAAMPIGMLRRPGADDYIPVTFRTDDHGNFNRGGHSLWDPSGGTVVSIVQAFSRDDARGQVTVLPMLFWHLLKVRDESSSRRLRAISHEQCAALLHAAAEDRPQQKGGNRVARAVAFAGGKEPPEPPLTNLLPAVKKLLPSAPERMAVGIARVVEKADREGEALVALRDKASADSVKETRNSALVVASRSDSGAAHWNLPLFQIYSGEGTASVSAHLTAAAEFLKGESKGGDLPRTNYLWFAMLENLPLRCWQAFWRSTAARMTHKDKAEVPWLEFLKLWHELGVGALTGQFDVMEGIPEGITKKNWGRYDIETEAGKSFTIQNGDDRFILVENDAYDQLPYQFLRYSTAESPANPPGYQVKNVRKIKARHDPGQIAAFIAAVEASAALPLPSKEELAEVARNLSTSPAEIGLIWLGGLNLDSYQNNFLPGELRTALGWKTTDASAARQSLRNLKESVLAHLYEAVVAEGMAAPFAADRGPVLRAIEKAWRARMPKRLQLDAALQKRLSALGQTSRWHRLNHEEVLAVAADPENHPLLQPREIEIQVSKDRSYGSLQLGSKNKNEQVVLTDSIRAIVQLIAMVHAETPVGHPARADMPALLKQTTKLLNSPGTLLDLRSVYVYVQPGKKSLSPTEWVNKHVGKTKANAKDGTARLDDGLLVAAALDSQHQALIAFRPAKLKDDGDLTRLHGLLSASIGPGSMDEDEMSDGGFVPVVVLVKSPGFQKLAKAIMSKETPTGQWPQNPRHTAPSVVKSIQKKHKLGEEAAVLYSQLLALPDPTTANLCLWNGWTAGQMKKASAELVGHKLVLEATRARAGRSIFLPGEWLELKAPWLPIEAWKLPHLVEVDMNVRVQCPIGGPMVLRPFDELFAAAWQRVLDGDAPRYQDVKKKRK